MFFKKKRKPASDALNTAYKRRSNSTAYIILDKAHPVVKVVRDDATGIIVVEVYKEGIKKPVDVYVYSEVCFGKAD